jgi:Septum formation
VRFLRNGKVLVTAALVLVLAGVAFWWLRRPEQVANAAPGGTPAVGSCWNLDETAARSALPWAGSPVECTAQHTVEVYYVGQVDAALLRQEHKAKGDEKAVADNLMYAQARLACGNFASVHLGGNWHDGRVSVVADWVNPVRDGFFGCALAQVADPAGKHFVPRTASLKGTLGGGGEAGLAAGCVDAGGTYASCDQVHRSEYVGFYTVTPPNAPFNASGLQTAVINGCAGLVSGFLGQSSGPARADVSVAYVGPTTAADWVGSDQTYACYAKAATDVRGSIRNLGTRPLPH